MKGLVLILLFLCMAAHPSAFAKNVRAGDYKDSVLVGQKKRSYLVHVPKNHRGESLPVVIVFHGGLANAKMSQWNARMIDKSDRDNFIVVYPHGSSGVGKHLLTWNAGSCCGLAATKNVDDIGFVRAMIKELITDYGVDASRVFVTGMSNGGMMAYRVANELSDLVAAAAPVEGCMLSGEIRGKQPISIIAFSGTEDKVVKYEGGTGSFFGYKIKCPAVKDTIKVWVDHNKCREVPKIEGDGEVVKEIYTGGIDGTEVCLYTLKAGHVWPGGRSKAPLQKTTKLSFSATDAMCEFFWHHPKVSHESISPETNTIPKHP